MTCQCCKLNIRHPTWGGKQVYDLPFFLPLTSCPHFAPNKLDMPATNTKTALAICSVLMRFERWPLHPAFGCCASLRAALPTPEPNCTHSLSFGLCPLHAKAACEHRRGRPSGFVIHKSREDQLRKFAPMVVRPMTFAWLRTVNHSDLNLSGR